MLATDQHSRDSDPFAAALESYLERTLHVPVSLAPWIGGADLPVFLTRAYKLLEAHIAGVRLILLAAEAGAEGTPSDIGKHVEMVEAAFGGIGVYAAPSISATLRARLIEAGIAFIAPGNQLYIPALAMDLRERFRRPKAQRPDKLSPSAQAVLFRHVLFTEEGEDLTPSTLADPLRYSPMTIGRAFDELAAVSLANVERQGREKHLRFVSDAGLLIDTAKTLLISPISKRFAVRLRRNPEPLQWSGLSALIRLTDLAGDEIDTFALSQESWRSLKAEGVVEMLTEDYGADAIIETWRYDPRGLSDRDMVDPLSLYAQFWNHDDPRISMAADQLLERFSW